MVDMAVISKTSEHICQATISILYRTAIYNYAKKPNKGCQRVILKNGNGGQLRQRDVMILHNLEQM